MVTYPLDRIFLQLFSIALAKDAWVAEVWEQIGKGGYCNLHFTRQIHD